MSEEETNAQSQDNTSSEQTEESQGLLGSEPGDQARQEPPKQEGTENAEKKEVSKEDTEKTLLGKEEKTKTPETYEEFKLPEGYSLEGETKEKFEAFAREMALDQEAAQKAIDYMAEHNKETAEARNQEYIKDRMNWREQLRKDPDFGGDSFDATVNKANMVIRKYGDEDVIDLLNSSGLGDHPSMVKMFTRISGAFGEDKTPHTEGAGQVKQKSLAEVMYPNQGAN